MAITALLMKTRILAPGLHPGPGDISACTIDSTTALELKTMFAEQSMSTARALRNMMPEAGDAWLYGPEDWSQRGHAVVSFAVLMAISTRHNELFKSLRSLGIPNIFIQILDMTYRYIFFFVKVFEEMHLGLKSRLIKNLKRKDARRWVGARIGYLFKRSLKMSEEVYMALIARGYTGEFKKYGK